MVTRHSSAARPPHDHGCEQRTHAGQWCRLASGRRDGCWLHGGQAVPSRKYQTTICRFHHSTPEQTSNGSNTETHQLYTFVKPFGRGNQKGRPRPLVLEFEVPGARTLPLDVSEKALQKSGTDTVGIDLLRCEGLAHRSEYTQRIVSSPVTDITWRAMTSSFLAAAYTCRRKCSQTLSSIKGLPRTHERKLKAHRTSTRVHHSSNTFS